MILSVACLVVSLIGVAVAVDDVVLHCFALLSTNTGSINKNAFQ